MFIPVSDFLTGILRTVLLSSFLGYIIPAIKLADRLKLFDNFYSGREGIDDVTRDIFMVLTQKKPDDWNLGGLKVPCCQEMIEVERLFSTSENTIILERNFLEQLNYVPKHTSRRSKYKDQKKFELTSIGSEITDFFHLSERFIPCLIIILLYEKRIVVIKLDNEFNIYSFLKNVTEKTISTKEKITKNKQDMKSSKEELLYKYGNTLFLGIEQRQSLINKIQ